MRRLLLVAVLAAAVLAVAAAAYIALDPGDGGVVADRGPERGETGGESVPAEPGRVRIAGTVEDGDGKPVVGASVYLLERGDPIVPADGPLHARSDGAGAFALSKDEGEDLDLIAAAPGYRPALIEHASGDGLRVVLDRGGSIRGLVVDDLDRPVIGATVTARTGGRHLDPLRGLFLPHHETLPLTFMRTISGLGGAFVIHGVGEGEVDLVAEKRTHPELLETWRGATAGERDVKLVLLRPFTASVAVVDAERNEPIVSAWVAILLPDEEKEIRGRTDRSGEMLAKLAFPAARAPEVRVKVSAGTENHGSVVADGVPLSKLEEGEGFTLRLAKRDPAILRLTIRYDTGKPYRNWIYFEVEPSFGDTFNRWSRIDKDGLATIQVPPGHYKEIRPRVAGGRLLETKIANLKLDSAEEYEQTITIERGGDLELKVTAGDQPGPRGARVVIEHADGTSHHMVWGPSLWVPDVPPGPAKVSVTFAGYEPASEDVTVVKDERRTVTLTLRRPPRKGK